MISGWEWLLIVFVALMLFGPKKLPELGRAVGKGLREFKRATSGMLDDENKAKAKEETEQKKTV